MPTVALVVFGKRSTSGMGEKQPVQGEGGTTRTLNPVITPPLGTLALQVTVTPVHSVPQPAGASPVTVTAGPDGISAPCATDSKPVMPTIKQAAKTMSFL